MRADARRRATKKPQVGGKREGAGRKPMHESGRMVEKCVSLPAEMLEDIEQWSQDFETKGVSATVRSMLRAAFDGEYERT